MNIKRSIFESKIDKSGDCWLWNGAVRPDGYGRYSGVGAHRIAYTLWVGSIPPGLEIDHICRRASCVNPAHLEPVTRAENMRRRTALVTRCRNGHEFSPENTYVYNGRRICRSCNRDAVAAYQARCATKQVAE